MKCTPGVPIAVCALLCLAPGALAQPGLAGASQIQFALDRLNVRGSALMIAAHPDDENTALLAWLARGRNARTGYLSITRGEGGQNLIGSEQGRLLGVIRTQELLAARHIDGAEQFFTAAVDFGFSKSAEETLERWGHERTLGEIVYRIRQFRPDVIILRFSGTPRDGHGNHQASAMLGKEAFFAAADPKRFPEQLASVKPWQPKRLLWNAFSFSREQEKEAAKMPGRLEVDLGAFSSVLGYSYAEIAGISRSEHRSQGMGSQERRGSMKNYLVHVAGEQAQSDLFDGVETSWPEPMKSVLRETASSFDPHHPEKTIALLSKARTMIDPERRPELDEAIALCAGLWLDVSTDRPVAVTDTKVGLRIEAVDRSCVPVEWGGKPLPCNMPEVRREEILVSKRLPEPQEYEFRLKVQGHEIVVKRPVQHRYVDRVRGELTRPLGVVPPVSLRLGQTALMFPTAEAREIAVVVRGYGEAQSGTVRLALDSAWKCDPPQREFQLAAPGQEAMLRFKVTPPATPATATLRAVAEVGGAETSTDVIVIDYPHIPIQTVYEQAASKIVRADVKLDAHWIGYIMGAGDEVPDALAQIGCEVTQINAEDLADTALERFDAIVTGVRAYNTHPELVANQSRLMQYVANGGTLVVQYNVLEQGGALEHLGPYPFKIGRERVTVEESPVEVLRPDHVLLSKPNKITDEDFAAWVQERGLYFATEWDPRYETVIASHDPGEKPLRGGLLYARYGKGAYVFTAYSWFRQLPAGVPGAYRIFANLLSAGKAQ